MRDCYFGGYVMDFWQSSVFQLLRKTDRRSLGSAFAIFGQRVLTCRHVLEGQMKSALPQVNGHAHYHFPELALFRSAGEGRLTVTEWAINSHYDVACGRIADSFSRIDPIPLHTTVVHPQQRVTCAGFPGSDGEALHLYERSVAAPHGNVGFVLNGALAPGMSGGPVLLEERAIGIMQADIVDESRSFLVPLNLVSSWIGEAMPTDARDRSGPMSLSSYPIRPSITPSDIPRTIIETFADAFQDRDRGIIFFNGAMALRKTCNLEGFDERQIVVRHGELDWRTDPEAHWARIFYIALQKSQRTLAALFLAPDAPQPALLSGDDAAIFEGFLNRLKH